MQPSYVNGPSQKPLIGDTIGRYFETICARFPDHEAIVSPWQNARLNYAQLREMTDRVAQALLANGLEKGDRLGVWSPNRYEWIVIQMAAARIGAILVTINPAYRIDEARYALTKVGCRGLIVTRSLKTSDYYAMLQELWQGPDARGDLPELDFVVGLDDPLPEGWLGWGDLLAGQEGSKEVAAALSATEIDDPINIQFTSGTTGAPKGATLTHHNILNNGYFVGELLRMRADDRLCLIVPLFHCFGLVQSVLAAFTHGATLVLPGPSFDAGRTLDTIAAEQCSILYGVPTMFISLLSEQARDTRDLSSLRTGIMAGAPCPIETMRQVVDALHLPEITICYGMTETSPVSFQSTPDDTLERRCTTVGVVHPHVEVKIVDVEGRIVPRGEKGQLLTRGYSVMAGYWGDEAKTAEAITSAGWMQTGDLAVIDEDGYCSIVGRLKDMIIRGGENIYPREVEEALFRHEAIAEVQVFGIPDEKFGEIACAWVRLADNATLDETALRAWCRDRLAHYKIPAHFTFVESLPLTASGKPQKFIMRDDMIRMLAEQSDRQTA